MPHLTGAGGVLAFSVHVRVHQQRSLSPVSIKTVLSAAVLAMLPGLSFAMCGGEARSDQQAMTCSEGTQWDTETATCVPVINS
jgi:hypothetical protein